MPADSGTSSRDGQLPGPRASQSFVVIDRKREADELLSLLLARRIVLLHSRDGVGKSALIRALLIPQLRDQGGVGRVRRNCVVLELDLHAPVPPDPNHPDAADRPSLIADVREQLCAAMRGYAATEEPSEPDEPRRAWAGSIPERSETLALAELVAGFRLRAADDGETFGPPLVLIFDSYEEFFAWDHAARTQFLEQLAPLLRLPNVWALFVLNDDHVGALLDLRRFFPGELGATFYLNHPSPDDARKAIAEATEGKPVRFSPEVVEAIIKAATVVGMDGEYIDALGLQIICEKALDDLAHGRKPTPTVQSLAGRRRNFVKVAIRAALGAEAGRGYGRMLRWIRARYIVDDGRRCLHRHEQSERGWVERLEANKVLRVVRRGGLEYSELDNDGLIQPILDLQVEERERTVHRALLGAGVAIVVIAAASAIVYYVAEQKRAEAETRAAAASQEAQGEKEKAAAEKKRADDEKAKADEADELSKKLERQIALLTSIPDLCASGELYVSDEASEEDPVAFLREKCLKAAGVAGCERFDKAVEFLPSLLTQLANRARAGAATGAFAIARRASPPLEVALLPPDEARPEAPAQLFLRPCAPSEKEMAGVVNLVSVPAAISVAPTGHHVAWWSPVAAEVVIRKIRRPEGNKFSQHVLFDPEKPRRVAFSGQEPAAGDEVLAALAPDSGYLAVFGDAERLTLITTGAVKQPIARVPDLGDGPVLGGVIRKDGGAVALLLRSRPPDKQDELRKLTLELIADPGLLRLLCGVGIREQRDELALYFDPPARQPAPVNKQTRLISLGRMGPGWYEGKLSSAQWEGVRTLDSFGAKVKDGILLSEGRQNPWSECPNPSEVSQKGYKLDNAWFVPIAIEKSCPEAHGDRLLARGSWNWVPQGEAGSCTAKP